MGPREAAGAQLHQGSAAEGVAKPVGRRLNGLSPLGVRDDEAKPADGQPIHQGAQTQWPTGLGKRHQQPPAPAADRAGRQDLGRELGQEIEGHHRPGKQAQGKIGVAERRLQRSARLIGVAQAALRVVAHQGRGHGSRHPRRDQRTGGLHRIGHVRRGRVDAGEDVGVEVEHGAGQ